MWQRVHALVSAAVLSTLTAAAGAAVNIDFDYSLDTTGFFTDPARQAVLQRAGQMIDRFLDGLAAIQPSGSNTWQAGIYAPNGISTGATQLLNNPSVTADEVRIYVGGDASMGGSTLAESSPGWVNQSSGTATWVDTVAYRGQSAAKGIHPTDFGPWGGSIGFNTTTNWSLSLAPGNPPAGQTDLLSVAVHELGHVFGFGSADSFINYTSAGTPHTFTGPLAVKVGSPGNPTLQLSADGAHWAYGTTTTVAGTSQEAAMSPALATGQRKLFTGLDYAALADVGWRQAIAGDVNRDGQVNSADVSEIISQGRFNDTTQVSGWSAGDFNGDGLVNSADISAMIAAGEYNAGQYADSSAPAALAARSPVSLTTLGTSGDGKLDLEYNPATGDVRLRQDSATGGTGSKLGELRLLSSSGQLLAANSTFTGAFDTVSANELDGLKFNPQFFADGFDLGNVLNLGLSTAGLLSDLTVQYTFNGGPSRQGGDLTVAGGTSVPEPASVGVIALAGLFMAARRRRLPAREA